MFLYNVTVGVDKDAEEAWLVWMQNEHIPDVLATNMFTSHRMYKVLHDNDDGTTSYSIQYFAKTLDDVSMYLEKFAPALIEKHKQKFGGKHVAFRTLLQEL